MAARWATPLPWTSAAECYRCPPVPACRYVNGWKNSAASRATSVAAVDETDARSARVLEPRAAKSLYIAIKPAGTALLTIFMTTQGI